MKAMTKSAAGMNTEEPALGQGEVAVLRRIRAVRDNCHLNDPRSRTSYDAEYRRHGRAAQAAFVPPPASDPQDQAERRSEILRLLYRRRQAHPDQPSLGLRELEAFVGTSQEHLEFSLWYLKETGYTRPDL
jgi:hypothetical protein